MMRWMLRLRRAPAISCAQVHDLVQAYLDGELEGPERDRLAAHLDRCGPCGVEAATIERIKASLAAPVPAEAVGRLTRFAVAISHQGRDEPSS
jgi:anti-sigma factor RsiW